MFSKQRIFALCAAIPLAAAVACEQGAERLIAGERLSVPQQSQLDVAATVLNIADVEQLYAAVNDPANEGAGIILAPGTYVLSTLNAAGVARPNGGRLELQQNMSLYGVTGSRSAVVIDATGLPASSMNLPLPQAPTNRMTVSRSRAPRKASRLLSLPFTRRVRGTGRAPARLSFRFCSCS